MIPFINLKINPDQRSKIDKVIAEVLGSGSFILGKKVGEFEKNFANFVRTKYAIGVASGTDAIRLSLRACGVEAGDKVLTVAFTSPFTALAVIEEGAIPVFCDIDEETLTIDPTELKRKIDLKVKAILPVHIYGNPCNMAEILKVATSAKIKVVEDACQAHGASIKGKYIGSFGDTASFSFYPTKNLGALGDGGVITTSDPKLAKLLTCLRNGGQTKRFYHKYKGTNCRLDEIQAAILNVKLTSLEELNSQRQKLADKYKKGFAGLPVKFQEVIPGAKSANHLFVIRTSRRNDLKKFLERKGIGCDIYYPWPLYLLPVFKKYSTGNLPVTQRVSREILALPLYPHMTENDQTKIIKMVKQFFNKSSEQA